MKSYSDLYSQIKQMVSGDSGRAYPGIPVSSGPAFSAPEQEILSSITESLGGNIIEGLEVTATIPPSMTVNINHGYGYIKGRRVDLPEDKSVTLPTGEGIWYLTIGAGLQISKFESNTDLVIAKIIIPTGGLRIVQEKALASGPDGYIVSGTYVYNSRKYDPTDPAFRDAVASAMPDIFAENIFGTLRLSENLKISNSKGTMEARSDGMRFFDTEGRVLAEYLSSRARVAGWNIEPGKLYSQNILIDSANESIGTTNFVSGALGKGWRITPEEAEFQNARIRGVFSTAVFKKDTISASNAMNIWSNSSVLKADLGALDSDTTITVEDAVFAIGERVRLKYGFSDEWMAVTTGPTANGNYWNYTVTRDLSGNYSANNNPAWQIGTAIVSFGNWNGSTGTGFIMLDAASANSPYIDYYMRTGGAYDSYAMKARIGRLTGVTDPDFGNLSGYGFYAENAYLKGSLFLQSGMYVGTGTAGSRIMLTDSELQAFNGSMQTFKLSATNGSFIFGDVAKVNKYVEFNPTTGALTLKGELLITGGSGLSALSDATADSIAESTTKKWAGETGATVGATWAGNLSGRPVELTDGRIATALNTSGTVVTKVVPTSVAGASASGLYVGSDYLGYYSGTAWKTYMQNNGNFYLSGTGTHSLAWDGTTLTIRGALTADDITAGGTITGSTLQTGGAGTDRIEIAASTKEIRWKDTANTIYSSIGRVGASDPIFANIYYKASEASDRYAIRGALDNDNVNPGDAYFKVGVLGEAMNIVTQAVGYGVWGKASGASGTRVGGWFSGPTADVQLGEQNQIQTYVKGPVASNEWLQAFYNNGTLNPGSQWFPFAFAKIVTWSGTGSAQSISCGFSPDMIIGIRKDTVSGRYWWSWISGMATDRVHFFHDGNMPTGIINSIDSAGFTVGTNANSNEVGATYSAICIKVRVN